MGHDAVRVKSHHSSVSPSTPEGKGKNVGDNRCAVERNLQVVDDQVVDDRCAAALLQLEKAIPLFGK